MTEQIDTPINREKVRFQHFILFNILKNVKVCPMLIRVFYKEGGQHHSERDFIDSVPSNEVNIHTW